MKKLVVLLMLLPLTVVAQKIKIKRGKLLLDKKEVALVDDVKRHVYQFSDLSKNKVFKATCVFNPKYKNYVTEWVLLEGEDGQKAEVPYEMIGFSFSVQKLLTRLLVQKYDLINANGINKEKLNELFNKKGASISDKYKVALAEKEAFEKKKSELVAKYKPFVKKDGTVLHGGRSGKIVGNVTASNGVYTVYDLDRIKIATAKNESMSVVKVNTYSGENFVYDEAKNKVTFGSSNSFNRDDAQALVEELLVREYELGRKAKSIIVKQHKEKQAIRKEQLETAKKNSSNFYEVDGYVIDKDGKKHEGKITAIFEKVSLGDEKKTSGIYDLDEGIDKLSKFVTLKYLNKKGKERIKKFSAKKNVVFCVNEGKECFYGMKTKGNALKKISNALSFGFDNSYFYKKEYEKDGHMILSTVNKTKKYVLKFADKKVGFMVDFRNNKNLSKALSKFIKNCKSLSEDILNNEFELSEFKNLKTIINEYATCK